MLILLDWGEKLVVESGNSVDRNNPCLNQALFKLDRDPRRTLVLHPCLFFQGLDALQDLKPRLVVVFAKLLR